MAMGGGNTRLWSRPCGSAICASPRPADGGQVGGTAEICPAVRTYPFRRTHIGTDECLGHAAIKGIPFRSIIGLIYLARDSIGGRLWATFAANPSAIGG